MFPLPRLPTPNIPGLNNKRDLGDLEVYPPSEDTHLFLDCLTNEIQEIVLEKPQMILEMGSGSGCVITYLIQLIESANHCFERNDRLMPFYLSIDINPKAVMQTQQTAKANCNGHRLDAIQSSLFQSLSKRATFDLILFNPPYVVSTDDDLGKSDIDASWAGGYKGRVIIDNFLNDLENYLSPKGNLYLLLEKSNDSQEIIGTLSFRGYFCQEVISRRLLGEHLSIWKIRRKS